MGKTSGEIIKIPMGLQWLNGKADTWPTTGGDTSKEGRNAAFKAAQAVLRPPNTNNNSSKNYYGPNNGPPSNGQGFHGNQNSNGRGGKGRGGGRKGGRGNGKGKPCLSCLCTDAQSLHILAHDSNKHTIPVCITQEGVEIKLEALIDTGALQGNYISHQRAEYLKGLGFVHNDIRIRVCAAYNDCQLSTESLTLYVIFNFNNIKHKAFECILNFSVLKSIQYDLIIGRIDIRKYNIWQQTEHTYDMMDTVVNNNDYIDENTKCTKLVPVHTSKTAMITDQTYESVASIESTSLKRKCIFENIHDQRVQVLNSTQEETLHQSTLATANDMAVDIKEVEHCATEIMSNDRPLSQNFPYTAESCQGRACNSEACVCYKSLDLGKTDTNRLLNLVVKDHLEREPKCMHEAYHGAHESDAQLALDWCYDTSSERLHALSESSFSGGTVHSAVVYTTEIGAKPTVSRAHISEFIHFEDEAQGIETSASDLPDYQWSKNSPDLRSRGHGTTRLSHDNEMEELQTTTQTNPRDFLEAMRKETCYIPTKIFGSKELQVRIRAVCQKHIKCFNTKLGADCALVRPMTIDVDESKWCVRSNMGPPRLQTLEKQGVIETMCLEMLKYGIISISTAEYYSQVHLTPKPVHGAPEGKLSEDIFICPNCKDFDIASKDIPNDKLCPKCKLKLKVKQYTDNYAEQLPDYKSPSNISEKAKTGWRFCIDFRKFNECSKGIGNTIPNIRHMLQRVGQKRPKCMGKLDLTSGYHQAPLAKESRRFTAFITHMGVFEWNRVVMGQKGAGAWFQSILATVVLLGILYIICELYIDDLLIFGKTDDEFVENLDTVLGRMVKYNITVNPDKCELGLRELEFVGHVVNENGLTHTREKIDKILQIPPPTLGKDLKSFLGVAIWVCDHIQNYSTIVRPLHLMMKNYSRERRLVWTQEARDAFEELKTAINNCTLLYFIDEVSEIKLYTDASDFGVGGYLCQLIKEKELPIAFVSHSLSEQEINWSTIEKECYAIVFCLAKLNYLLDGRRFTLKTDHKNLTFMDADTNPKSQTLENWNPTL
jgi:hypothetical protein